MEKHRIFMVKYDGSGNPIGAAYGLYKQADIDVFRTGGFVDVEEGLARNVSEEIAERLLANPSSLPKG